MKRGERGHVPTHCPSHASVRLLQRGEACPIKSSPLREPAPLLESLSTRGTPPPLSGRSSLPSLFTMGIIVLALRCYLVFQNVFITFKTLKSPPPSSRNNGLPSVRALTQRKRDMKGCMAIWIVWVSRVTLLTLDRHESCPPSVPWRFMNQSWRK